MKSACKCKLSHEKSNELTYRSINRRHSGAFKVWLVVGEHGFCSSRKGNLGAVAGHDRKDELPKAWQHVAKQREMIFNVLVRHKRNEIDLVLEVQGLEGLGYQRLRRVPGLEKRRSKVDVEPYLTSPFLPSKHNPRNVHPGLSGQSCEGIVAEISSIGDGPYNASLCRASVKLASCRRADNVLSEGSCCRSEACIHKKKNGIVLCIL